ncbi:MAG: dockerin type I repeat-containing protein, partial [Acidobacteria bacterium]|nr:dockerin type I repeat-containing protein [Acidobacteriota bacterium]
GYYQYGWLSTGVYKVGFGRQQTVFAEEWYDNQPGSSSADLVSVTQEAVTVIDAQLARCELAITVQPQNRQVTAGQTAALSVTAASELPLSYQWYEGYAPDMSHPVGGATDPVLVTPPLGATTSYWVHVSNVCQEVDSTTATVWVVGACESPPAPALSVPGAVGNGQAYTLTWTDVSPLGTYELQEATAPDFSGAAAWLVTGTGFPQSHVVAADTYYYYRVRAYVTCNGGRLDSPWSGVDHVAVLFGPLEPADLDGNGLITAEDCMLLAAYLCGDIDLVNGGDLNGDGLVGATDLAYMLHFLTGTFK